MAGLGQGPARQAGSQAGSRPACFFSFFAPSQTLGALSQSSDRPTCLLHRPLPSAPCLLQFLFPGAEHDFDGHSTSGRGPELAGTLPYTLGPCCWGWLQDWVGAGLLQLPVL